MNMETLVALLKQEQLSCVVSQHHHIYKETSSGIRPIMKLLEEDHLKDALIVDKVIGKAAAMMLAYGGIRQIHAVVISQPALTFLKTQAIKVSYESLVPYIINRKQDGMCPMEQCVLDIEDMNVAYHALKKKLTTL